MATVAFLITKAKEDLGAAKLLLDNNYHRLSLVHAYYSAFHMIEACMLTMGETSNKHQQLLGSFNKAFIHAKKVDIDFKILYALFNGRHNADYGDLLDYSYDEAAEGYQNASNVFETLRDFLSRNGYLLI